MSNNNCLDGISCPRCDGLGPFWIEAVVHGAVLMSDEGTLDHSVSHTEWAVDAPITCAECSHSDTVARFSEKTSPLQQFTERVFEKNE